MYRKLQVKITFFCTIVTGLILIAMSCICLYIVEKGIKETNKSSFINNRNTIISYLENQTIISHTWILKAEKNFHFQIDIKDKGYNLVLKSLVSDRNKEYLIALANETALNEYGLDIENPADDVYRTIFQEFKIKDRNNQLYNASVVLIPKESGLLSVAILYSYELQDRQILHQRKLFGGVVLCAIILLSVFFWLFTRYMIRPIKENHDKQIHFIAAISHKLYSPLTAILSGLSDIRRIPHEKVPGIIQKSVLEGEHMSRLINDMLSLTNADANNWKIYPELVEIDTLLLQIYEKFDLPARSKGLKFMISLPDKAIPLVSCDDERISQAISVLLDNIFSVMSEGGTIQMSLSSDNNQAEIKISDNGLSLPREYKNAGFKKLYKIGKIYNVKDYFGMGLYIVNEIMKAHDGNMILRDNKGGGITIIISLPI